MCGEEGGSLQGLGLSIPVFCGSRKSEGTGGKQSSGGRSLHILDALLKGMAINRVCMKRFEQIVLSRFLLRKIPVGVHFFQEDQSLQCSTACIDPLHMP